MEAVIGLVMYLLPAVIANMRRHHQQGSIFVLNLLLGWTIIGWIVALVWSVSAVHVERRSPWSKKRAARWEDTKAQLFGRAGAR